MTTTTATKSANEVYYGDTIVAGSGEFTSEYIVSKIHWNSPYATFSFFDADYYLIATVGEYDLVTISV